MILSHVISDLAGKERDVGENLFEGRVRILLDVVGLT
jgi:hypothetical protein